MYKNVTINKNTMANNVSQLIFMSCYVYDPNLLFASL